MTKQEVAQMVLKRVDLKGLLVEDLLEKVIYAKLQEVVADSSNPYDDGLLNFVYPMLKSAADKWISEVDPA